MRLAIHQPEFMPWGGFFYKMTLSDLYVIFDHVQFKKRYFENRNQVVSPKGEISYIRVPVLTKGKEAQALHEVKIDNTQKWNDKMLKKIRHFYSKAPYFRKYFDELAELIAYRKYVYLIDLNIKLIDFFRKHLGISVPMVSSSQMNVKNYTGSDLIMRICLLNKADIYLCGASGIDYIRADDFCRNGIQIKWLNYSTPAYSQLCDKFVPNMSTLDLLFNRGNESLNVLMNSVKRKD